MVGDRHLSHSDHLVQHHDVLHQTVRKCMHRHLIGAGISICCHSFIFQGMGFCQQCCHIPSDTVRADASHYRGNTVPDQISQRSLRCPRVESALSPSTEDMFMTVNESRDSRHALSIDFPDFNTTAEVCFQILTDCSNPLI